jgi:hypothetical protein
MRVDAAQDLIVSGLGVWSIVQAGGWKTMNVVGRYVEKANLESLSQKARELGSIHPARPVKSSLNGRTPARHR